MVTPSHLSPVRQAVLHTVKLLDKSKAGRDACRELAKLRSYDINDYVRNYIALSQFFGRLSTGRPMIRRPAQESMAKNPTSATMASVHRLMSSSGRRIKDNSNALLCVWNVCAVGALSEPRFGGLFAYPNSSNNRLSGRLSGELPTGGYG